jgi:hypothetical protein
MKEVHSKCNSKPRRLNFSDSSSLKNTHRLIAENSKVTNLMHFGKIKESSKKIKQGKSVSVSEYGEIKMRKRKQDEMRGSDGKKLNKNMKKIDFYREKLNKCAPIPESRQTCSIF